MANLDDSDDDVGENPYNRKDKKKILLFLVPSLIVIGIIVGLYFILSPKKNEQANLNYSVVEKKENDITSVTIFYDLPEVAVRLQGPDSQNDMVKVKINIELSKMEDIKTIESLMPRITDAVIAHTMELAKEEISGSEGLYWLKEELLYRMNLITSPVQISNLNFKNIEILKVN